MDAHKLGHAGPVTDTTAAVAARNPWAYWLSAAGALVLVVAFVITAVPPAHSSTAAGEIVNFPAMFAQYATAVLIGLVGAVLLLAGLLTAAQDWSRRH